MTKHKTITLPIALLITVISGSIIGYYLGSRFVHSQEPARETATNPIVSSVYPPVTTQREEPEPNFYWPAFVPEPFYENIQPVADPYGILVLVNKSHQLAADFSPSDLRLLSVLDFYNNPATTMFMRDVAATAVEALFQAAFDEEGLVLWARSAYRSYQTQQHTHARMVSQMGQVEADRWSARPGHSEHQTGLALDITSAAVNGTITQGFSNTPEGIWLRENAHRFGFIMRYPYNREAETGYAYEPWHIRYVGMEAAAIIFENNLILEQYLLGPIKKETP